MGFETERRQFQNNTKNSAHLGAVGQKISGTGVVVACRQLESQWGVSTMVKIVSDGNVLVWFASGSKDFELDKQIQWKGTVKKLEEYQGVKQTVLTRCSITAI
jgi:hypothetical protein